MPYENTEAKARITAGHARPNHWIADLRLHVLSAPVTQGIGGRPGGKRDLAILLKTARRFQLSDRGEHYPWKHLHLTHTPIPPWQDFVEDAVADRAMSKDLDAGAYCLGSFESRYHDCRYISDDLHCHPAVSYPSPFSATPPSILLICPAYTRNYPIEPLAPPTTCANMSLICASATSAAMKILSSSQRGYACLPRGTGSLGVAIQGSAVTATAPDTTVGSARRGSAGSHGHHRHCIVSVYIDERL
ncbi:hypothetical protein CGCVW01_v010864 [Colletotrichum viniferum]|nr:hypothetical protein CGCVW01_v010864 [Colletotrichum viniferum]